MDIKDLIKEGIIEPHKTAETKNLENALPVYKINHSPKPCEDCGMIVTDRTVTSRKHSIPHHHWRKSCSACKMYFNPKSGKWDISSTQLAQYYRHLTRKNKV